MKICRSQTSIASSARSAHASSRASSASSATSTSPRRPLQEAFAVALERWPRDGDSREPARLDRRDREAQSARPPAARADLRSEGPAPQGGGSREHGRRATRAGDLPDDRLEPRLHAAATRRSPSKPRSRSRSTRSAASPRRKSRARFVVPVPTMAQRLVRAKRKIHDAAIALPDCRRAKSLPERLVDGGLGTSHLVFNEGYAATARRRAREARPLDGGHPPRAARRRAPPGRARGAWPPRAHAPDRLATRGARGPRRVTSSSSRTRIGRSGIATRLPRASRSCRTLSPARPAGLYAIEAAMRRCTRGRRCPPRRTGARSRRLPYLGVLQRVRPVPRRRTQSRGAARDGRRAGGGSFADRGNRRIRLSRRLSPVPRRESRPSPPPRPPRGRRGELPRSARVSPATSPSGGSCCDDSRMPSAPRAPRRFVAGYFPAAAP